MSIFCKHRWEVISEVVADSALEQINKTGLKLDRFKMFLVKKPYLVILKCDKCGKVKQFKGVLE